MALTALPPAHAEAAEWQLRPFAGVTFGAATTFVSTEVGARLALGVSGVLLGNVVGLEGDVERVPGLFQNAEPLLTVASSSATTVTGNLIVAVPRRLTEYTLRPYFVGGVGLMRARIDRPAGGEGLRVASTLPAMDVGGGVTGFLSDRVGLSWEGRWFRSVSGSSVGLSIGDEKVSFWRATMAVAIRLTRRSQ